MRRSERGQVAPLIAVLVVAAGFCCVVVVRFGVAAVDRAGARTAADAIALAGAGGGRAAADDVARANAGRIVDYDATGRDVKVRAQVRDAAATAKARREAGGGRPAGAAPALRAVLARAAQLLGHEVAVRTVHAGGLAIDVAPDAVDELRSVAASAGLCQPSPSARPTYFEVCPAPTEGSDSLR
ncbi:MAG TPA: hypothetical protein VFB78_05245 [Acidimicrobiales bacterium]|nr:hypothetical protein [Acidimicrobiales bacterium]